MAKKRAKLVPVQDGRPGYYVELDNSEICDGGGSGGGVIDSITTTFTGWEYEPKPGINLHLNKESSVDEQQLYIEHYSEENSQCTIQVYEGTIQTNCSDLNDGGYCYIDTMPFRITLGYDSSGSSDNFDQAYLELDSNGFKMYTQGDTDNANSTIKSDVDGVEISSVAISPNKDAMIKIQVQNGYSSTTTNNKCIYEFTTTGIKCKVYDKTGKLLKETTIASL